MILDVLIEEFTKRFQHEKRARVCLWFDEKREFEGLLDKLQSRLTAITPRSFNFLQYDPDCFHGQIWIKDQVHRGGAESRFVIYLPLGEDRLNSPDENGEHHLELLEEYRIAGITWRLNGRQPTLFAFLRLAGIDLPDNPGARRQLCEGGRESLLAKYAARFADRPASFWSGTLTAEIARTKLVGDLEKTILDLAADPDVAWKTLNIQGLLPDFLEMVRDRYGYHATPDASASEWVRGLVEVLALTETFLGYGEARDFPFTDRLPPIRLREHHLQLLHRWLRDAEARPVWDRWISEVEPHLDLSLWSEAKEGFSFGLPHLVRLRWRNTLASFEKSAARSSTTETFFANYRDSIRREMEYAKASPNPVGEWRLLAALDDLLENCRTAIARIDAATEVHQLASLYVQEAPRIDGLDLQIASGALRRALPSVGRVASRVYAGYANRLNEKFFRLFVQHDGALAGFDCVTTHLQKEVWSRSTRQAVVIVDGFRLDAAYAVQDELRSYATEIHPMLAVLPTVTPIGMTALLPLKGLSVSFEYHNGNLRPMVKGKDTSIRANRLALMTEFGADCREIEVLENTAMRPETLGALLVVFGHEELDHIGHGSADALVRHLSIEVDRLATVIRKLHQWGYPEVHVVTDHGFILLDEEKLPPTVNCQKDWCYVRKERFALVPSSADLPLTTLPFAWDKSIRVALPPGLAFFIAEKAFSHGGAALQEMVIPHLVSRAPIEARRIGIDVMVPVADLTRASVRVILRSKQPAEAEPGQLALFHELGRTLRLDVLRLSEGSKKSVLASGGPKEVSIEQGGAEIPVTLFFNSAESFRKGEVLQLDVRDADTLETFPTGGTKLTIGRDM